MPWTIYDFLDNRGHNVISKWINDLDPIWRGKVDAKLRILQNFGPECPDQLLAGTTHRNIDKLRVRGKRNFRILLCKGPVDIHHEYTLLSGEPERDMKLPRGALDAAAKRREAIIQSPQSRRAKHDFEA